MGQELSLYERAIDDAMPTIANILAATPGLPARSFKAGLLSQMRNAKTAEKLAQCTLPSFLNCACTFAGLGLMPDGVTGQAFILPFKDKHVGMVATPIIGVMGYVTLGDRAGRTIKGKVVRDGDEFDWSEGSEEWVKHKSIGRPDARITHAWATMTSLSRTPVVIVLPIEELLVVMQKSPAVRFGGDTPYNDIAIGRPAMFEKTCKRRLKRSIPLVQGGQAFIMADAVEGQFEATGRPHFLLPGNDGLLHVTDGVTGDRVDIKPPPEGFADPTAPVKFFAQINAGQGPNEFPNVIEWRTALYKIIDFHKKKPPALKSIKEANAKFIEDVAKTEYTDDAERVLGAIDRAIEQAGK